MQSAAEIAQSNSTTEQSSEPIQYEVIGNTYQSLQVKLPANKSIAARASSLAWMTDDIVINPQITGMRSYLKNKFIESGISFNIYTSQMGTGLINLTPHNNHIGKIIKIDTSQYANVAVDKQSIMTIAGESLEDVSSTKDRFLSCKNGELGVIHILAIGDVAVYELEPEESLLVDPKHLLAYADGVSLQKHTLRKNLAEFSITGEGEYLFKVTGPGKVWTQTAFESFHLLSDPSESKNQWLILPILLIGTTAMCVSAIFSVIMLFLTV